MSDFTKAFLEHAAAFTGPTIKIGVGHPCARCEVSGAGRSAMFDAAFNHEVPLTLCQRCYDQLKAAIPQAPAASPPQPPEPLNQAEVIWLRFVVASEDFDRTLPGSWSRPDEWMPRGDYRSESIVRARLLAEDAILECKRLRLSPEVIDRARKWARELSYDRAAKILADAGVRPRETPQWTEPKEKTT